MRCIIMEAACWNLLNGIDIYKTQLPYPKSRPVHSTLGQISMSSDRTTGAHPSETTQHYTGASTMVQATPSNDTLTQTALERLNVQIFPPVHLVRLRVFVSIIMPQKHFKLQFWVPWGAATLICSLPTMSRKSLAHDIKLIDRHIYHLYRNHEWCHRP